MSTTDLPGTVPWRIWRFQVHHLILLLFSIFLTGFSLSVKGQAANLDQGANGKSTVPVSPVDWINGNLNAQQAHFLEGYSVPYRAILTDLVVNQTYTLVIGYDVRDGSKAALDYMTHYQRLEPHAPFGHSAETVSPLLNITGFPVSYFTSTDTEPIPAPSSAGSPVAGQPATSFNALPAGEKLMTGYNANLLSVAYASQGTLTDAHAETVVNVTFTALKETVVLAWGGHIASQVDWGEGGSASSINGSPYHMRLKNWIINGEVVTIGNQDRSLKTDAVFIPPKCDVTGPHSGCVETTSLTYTATVDNTTGLTYLWSIIGANTAGAKIVDNTLATIQVVPIGAQFLPGSFNLQLIVTRNGLKDTCYLDSHTSPGVNVIISKVTVNAGSDQNITQLDVAQLNAIASGGNGSITYKWTPTTGLSDPNIANPTFTPPSTGVFQFVVTATDTAGCSGKDTVVITVTEHPHPPCRIDGPDPVCPGSTNTYKGPAPADVGSYLWSVDGNGSIVGVNNADTVVIKAGDVCGKYIIQLITTTPDGKVKDTCYREVQVKDTIAPVLHGEAADANVTCSKDVPAAPTITATDNCQPEIKVKFSQSTKDSTCVNKFKIVRKWWAIDACDNASDTLTQIITVNDNVKPVITADFDKEISVQCLKDIPAAPIPTATDNCDGEVKPSFHDKGSGTACDSTLTRTWIFEDACGNKDSVTQVIHVKDTIKPVLSGDVKDVNVDCAKDVPAPPTVTATDNCDESVPVKFWQGKTDSTCVNRFKLLRKWWATDKCGNTSDTLKQLITVYDNVAPKVTFTPDDKNINCGESRAFGTPTFEDNCGGTVKVTYVDTQSSGGCPVTYTRTWTATDACGNWVKTKQSITVGCCDKFCTYTQGFYGNKGGVGCTPGGTSLTAKQIMTTIVDAQVGDSVIFGLIATGKFFTLYLSDITSDNIFKMLPGGGTPLALKGYATYTKPATWPNVPISTASTTFGKINNVLLAQTMALFFNMGITPGLSTLTIKSDSLFTSKLTTCGSSTPVDKIDTFLIPKSVVTYLQSIGQATVQGLYDLANKYLGGQTVAGVSIGDVSKAVDAINRAFDKCAALIGWGTSIVPLANTNIVSDANITTYKEPAATAPSTLNVSVYPNPYVDKLVFKFIAPETGNTVLELYNIHGQRLDAVYKGVVDKGSSQTIDYHVQEAHRGILLYRLSVGSSKATGKVISFK